MLPDLSNPIALGTMVVVLPLVIAAQLLHPLTFGKGLETVALNCGIMYENVLSDAFRTNETITLAAVEPLDGSNDTL